MKPAIRLDKWFVQLSDGGHFENLALYELIRRRVKLIIVADAAADPEFKFGDLENAVERVRVDFGVRIRFEDGEDKNLAGLVPGSDKEPFFTDKFKVARRGYAIAKIIYGRLPDDNTSDGTLIYIKSTLTRNLPADLYGYKIAHTAITKESSWQGINL